MARFKDTQDRFLSTAERTTETVEGFMNSATKGACDCQLKFLEIARTNANAAYDFAGEMMKAKSLADLLDISTTHVRRQVDTAASQISELSAIAQRVATETAAPIKATMSKTFNEAA